MSEQIDTDAGYVTCTECGERRNIQCNSSFCGYWPAIVERFDARQAALASIHAKLVTAQTLMMQSGWWTNDFGYQTDAALWIERAMNEVDDALPGQEQGDSVSQDPTRTS